MANLGVSIPVFVLGLLLAYLFAIVLKDTPFALPPSGRLSAGVNVKPLAEAWGLEDLGGLPRGILDFMSNIYTLNALLTLQRNALVDAARHLILPAIALGHDPDGDHRPDDPLEPPRRARARLRPDRPGQGAARAAT